MAVALATRAQASEEVHSIIKTSQANLLAQCTAALTLKQELDENLEVLTKFMGKLEQKEEAEGFYKLLPANKADHLCQVMAIMSNIGWWSLDRCP